jgi:PAS domain-containing protein
LLETSGFEAARSYGASAHVLETRQRYLQVLHEMEEEERRRLEERRDKRLRASEMTVVAGALATLALVALLSAAFFMIRRQLRATEAGRRALEVASVRLQTILDTVVDGIITINERGIVETLNPAAEFIFGYTATEVIGHNINMLMPEPYHSQHDGYIDLGWWHVWPEKSPANWSSALLCPTAQFVISVATVN